MSPGGWKRSCSSSWATSTAPLSLNMLNGTRAKTLLTEIGPAEISCAS